MNDIKANQQDPSSGLHHAFMSPLMVALPASTTHTHDMFEQLRHASELERIYKNDITVKSTELSKTESKTDILMTHRD